jgi:hypothetical protein
MTHFFICAAGITKTSYTFALNTRFGSVAIDTVIAFRVVCARGEACLAIVVTSQAIARVSSSSTMVVKTGFLAVTEYTIITVSVYLAPPRQNAAFRFFVRLNEAPISNGLRAAKFRFFCSLKQSTERVPMENGSTAGCLSEFVSVKISALERVNRKQLGLLV